MITMQRILEQLTGNTEALVKEMAEHFEELAQAQSRCHRAMALLAEEPTPDGRPSVKEELEAIEQQTASDLLFSCFLGLKANLDNFINPVTGNFLNADAETYLRENTAHRLPKYVQAQQVRKQFYLLLSPAQREVYADVTAYVSCLETMGPKLAHYYGYLLGNELLYRIIPGYHHDIAQTAKYTMLLEAYFGKALP